MSNHSLFVGLMTYAPRPLQPQRTLGVKSVALGGHFFHHLSQQMLHGREVAQDVVRDAAIFYILNLVPAYALRG